MLLVPLPYSAFLCHCLQVRYTHLVDILLAANKHVLCVGETGTGKTLNISAKLLNDMPPEVQPLCLTFSARTSANQTQDIIGGQMSISTQCHVLHTTLLDCCAHVAVLR